MRLATYVEGRRLYVRLHLTDQDKRTLRSHRELLRRRVLDRTPRSADWFDPRWITTFDELLGQTLALDCENKSKAYDFEEKLHKAVQSVEKEITMRLPPPSPTAPDIDEVFWFAHAVLVAQSQFGKTNILSWRLMELLPRIAEGKATAIVMEPKGSWIASILRLRVVWELAQAGRVIIIDPADVLVSVDVFDAGGSVNATTERLDRIFNIVTSGLTDLQRIPLTMAIRAMYAIGKPSMSVLKSILRSGVPDRAIAQLPETVAEFFTQDFGPQKGKADARAMEVINRFNAVLGNEVFATLLTTDHATFDMLTEIQRGTLIIINANPVVIGGSPERFGKFWVEDVKRCIYPRLAMPRDQRTQTFFFIDESPTYVSDDLALAELLDKAAEAKIGMFLAMQYVTQIEDSLVRNSILTNTALKFTAKSNGEIHELCRSMGAIDPQFIYQLMQYEFAHFGPNMETAIKVKFPKVDLSEYPQMTDEQYDEMRRMNREKYGYRRKPDGPVPADPCRPTDPSQHGGYQVPRRKRDYNEEA